ncbi:MAG: Tfp pilus assembly protein FimT/FimU [Chthoniobacteraceae bacterium]
MQRPPPRLNPFGGIPMKKGCRVKGFSLVELLVVMGIIVMLVFVAIPIFRGMQSAQMVTQGTYDAAGLLELARMEAITRRTYVWVGFQNSTPPGEIRMAAVYSRDGTSDANASNLMNLTRVLHIKNALMTNWDDLKNSTRSLLTDGTSISVALNSAGISFTAGTSRFEKTTITFTPRGQAMLKGTPTADDGYIPLIDVSFRQSHGQTVQPNADDSALIVNGATGTPKIIQLQ